MQEPLLQLSGVAKQFCRPRSPAVPPVKALDNISFAAGRGRILCLLGPNGAGKTTLLKIIAGLVLPDAGTVRIAGQDMVGHELQIKTRLGMVSAEDRSLYGRLTGLQNLECFAALYGLSRSHAARRIDELLRAFSVISPGQRLDRCSTGMRRTISLIQALIHDPEIILADELTRSLDLQTATAVRSHLKQLAGRGKTVVFATHNLEEAQEISDEFLILSQGQVRGRGTLAQLRAGGHGPEATLHDIYRNLTRHAA